MTNKSTNHNSSTGDNSYWMSLHQQGMLMSIQQCIILEIPDTIVACMIVTEYFLEFPVKSWMFLTCPIILTCSKAFLIVTTLNVAKPPVNHCFTKTTETSICSITKNLTTLLSNTQQRACSDRVRYCAYHVIHGYVAIVGVWIDAVSCFNKSLRCRVLHILVTETKLKHLCIGRYFVL